MKVAIIGGGICGLYLSWKLSKAGYEVTCFEKKKDIGKKDCSGLFSERILKFIPESQALIQNEINETWIHFPKRTVNVKFSKKFLVISHYELDRMVAGLAKSAGAKIILGHAIEGFDPIRNLISNGASRVIGCDGANSLIRKELKLANPICRAGILGFVPEKNSSSSVETWPTKNGFIWKIPRGKEIEYGIIESPEEAKSLLDKFLVEKNIKLSRMEAGLVPQGLAIPRNEKITLCGDAAGLTKPWSGGGVIWGLIAADMLLKNFPDCLEYMKVVKRFFLPRIIMSRVATRIVYFLGFKIPWMLPGSIKIENDFLL